MRRFSSRSAGTVATCAIVLFLLTWFWVSSVPGQVGDVRLHRLLLLRTDAPDAVLFLLRFLTTLGGFVFLTVIGLLSVGIAFALRRKHIAVLLLVALFGGRLMAIIIKMSIARARPAVGDHLVAVHSLSFPSEHAFNSTVTYGLLALLSGSRPTCAAAFGLAFGIGVSRILLGVHWPTDVIAGWALGIAWLSLCWGLRNDGLRHRPARGRGGA